MKTLKELLEEQNEWCDSHSCVGCPYAGYNPNPNAQSAECTTVFVYEKMKEAMDRLGEDAKVQTQKSTADKTKAVQLPKWCKVGAWVKDANGKLYNIERTDNGIICIRNPLTTLAYAAPVNTTHVAFNPVRFRPYTYKEAKGLLGKVIEYVTSEGYRVSQSVHSVQEGKGRVYINDADHEEYMRMQATIDGVPIGVPVVDEEALKGGEE